MTARCSSCGAPITWAVTTTGKRMPVDAEPAPNGNVELTPLLSAFNREPTEATVHAQRPLGHEGPLHLSHFVTCPQADEWRR